jgi:rSAM/selenodomain-associated transferase 1
VSVRFLVIAKAPLPGVSKTRLCPPCSPVQAAAIARAALADTLTAVAGTPALSRTIVLDGNPGDWLPQGFDVVPQRGFGLAQRLEAAFEDCSAPALLIGMDTPQVTPAHLEAASTLLLTPGVDAVLGPARDGGYWAIGFKNKPAGAFEGVPMSTERTAAVQRRRIEELGLACGMLPLLRDIDYWADAGAVAHSVPGSRLALAVERIEHALVGASA